MAANCVGKGKRIGELVVAKGTTKKSRGKMS